jgi:hypothetical protein
MGMTISGTVTYGKPVIDSLASMPAVAIAFSEAVIDKAYLTWLDVSKLLTAFPEHVKLVGDTVTFQGPVAIVSSLSSTQRLFAKCAIAFASGVITSVFVRGRRQRRVNHMLSSAPMNAHTKKMITIYSAVLGLINAGIGFYLAGRYLPTQAGVYIFRQPPFHV